MQYVVYETATGNITEVVFSNLVIDIPAAPEGFTAVEVFEGVYPPPGYLARYGIGGVEYVKIPDDLEAEKIRAIDVIERNAETTRLQWITSGSGQAMAYEAKRREAELYFELLDTDPTHYPFLAKEIGLTADTLDGVAHIVMRNAQAWTIVGPEIENIRLSAKRDVKLATNISEVAAVLANIRWPAPSDYGM